jgi:hypothetical protein
LGASGAGFGDVTGAEAGVDGTGLGDGAEGFETGASTGFGASSGAEGVLLMYGFDTNGWKDGIIR